MKIDIITLFPEMYSGPFDESILKRAKEKNIVEINFHNLREWGRGEYKKVDDNPFGGGAGMVLMIEPIDKCLTELKGENSKVIAMSAKGDNLVQSNLINLSNEEHLIILAGHYEGFDQRILDHLADYVFSIGNFVLTGGELPSMMLVDGIVRLLPGVLGNDESVITDSFYKDDKTKQYGQYTRPEKYVALNGEEYKVPDVLLSGNHAEIEKWRGAKK